MIGDIRSVNGKRRGETIVLYVQAVDFRGASMSRTLVGDMGVTWQHFPTQPHPVQSQHFWRASWELQGIFIFKTRVKLTTDVYTNTYR